MSEQTHANDLARILAGLILAQQPKTPAKFRGIHLAEQINALLREDHAKEPQTANDIVHIRGPPTEETQAQVYSIGEFCRAFRISRSALYAAWRAGRGPRIFRVGRTARISVEAARDWIAEREAEAAA